MHPSEESKKIFSVKVSNEANSIALNISKQVSTNAQTKQVFIPTGLSDIKDHLSKDDSPLLYHFLIDTTSAASEYVIFTVSYQDIAVNKYKQAVVCICDSYSIEIHPSLPELVT